MEAREGRGVGRRQGARVGRLISVPKSPTERAKFLNDNKGLDTTVHLTRDDAGGYGVKGLDADFTKKLNLGPCGIQPCGRGSHERPSPAALGRLIGAMEGRRWARIAHRQAGGSYQRWCGRGLNGVDTGLLCPSFHRRGSLIVTRTYTITSRMTDVYCIVDLFKKCSPAH